MKNILVPTDFSDCSGQAVEVAFGIAKKANAEIHFLHIFDSPVDWVQLPLEKEDLYPETRLKFHNASRKLNELVKRANELGLKSKEVMLFNEGTTAIDDHIKSHHHDFVVMGSHGVGGFKEIIGSNTQKVVRYSDAPVLVVKNASADYAVRNIVFASSFDAEAVGPFQKVIDFASLMNAQIHLLYVNVRGRFEETDAIESKIEEFLKSFEDMNFSTAIYDALNPERGILKFAEKIGADLIAVATHGRTGLMKMISPSVTESLVNHSEIPVLCLHT